MKKRSREYWAGVLTALVAIAFMCVNFVQMGCAKDYQGKRYETARSTLRLLGETRTKARQCEQGSTLPASCVTTKKNIEAMISSNCEALKADKDGAPLPEQCTTAPPSDTAPPVTPPKQE